jgi:hypothetical protein
LQENFLKRFIEEERYLQNPPLKTKDFMEFCRKRGIDIKEDELEFFEKEGLFHPIIRIDRPPGEEKWIEFEKDGKKYCRPAQLGLGEGEKEIRTYQKRYYSPYEFSKHFNKYLLNWLEEGNLFDPSKKPFKEWSSHKGKELDYDSEKIVSFYSPFQIYWLEILKKDYKIQLDFAGEEIIVSSNSYCTGPFNPGYFSINNIEKFNDKIKELTDEDPYFNFKNKKKCLIYKYKVFNKILEFLLSIQRFYYPYGKTDSKSIYKSGTDPDWHEKKKLFNPKKELSGSGLKISEIITLYLEFSKKTKDLLGDKWDDWIQLWERFSWDKKDKLEGEVRLGIEYLNWALMLKKFIEDYSNHEIFDIAEITDFHSNDISDLDLNADHSPRKRWCRDQYFDPEKNKNHYHDAYKMLFYLSNRFKLDYQPRIMVFVEGKSEEIVFPEIFKWFFGPPENWGIEIVNFKGVDKLLSTSKNAEELKALINEISADLKSKKVVIRNETHMKRLNKLIKDLKNTDIVISNWTSFISYNLEKWQIIPFFVSDNEGNVKHFLEAEKPIKFEEKSYDVPDDWKYLWGINNENKPLKGKDLEFANFTDEEIVSAINEVINDDIDINIVKEARKNGDGINKIHSEISKPGIKIDIVKKLFTNMYTKDDAYILEKPIFSLMKKIVELANLNHLPVNTEMELRNKQTILDLLNGKIKSILDDES